MIEFWFDITDLPAEGREFSFSDPSFWTKAFETFGVGNTVVSPLQADFFISPEGSGYLIRGKLTGETTIPCDRCMEDAHVVIDQDFDLFEELPNPEEEQIEPSFLRKRGKTIELNMGEMVWEQYVLAQPSKPLCMEDCKGLCPQCGANRNIESCDCESTDGDPRLAIFRNMQLNTKQ
ncbi:YceD family protein [Desulfovibrio inopinatus]|uniref:YceD family protein n=1 Tax=Desulfovibrio inopinatus TaxID=102109 RepID=UPI000410AAB8|nr:DUF177 domain-containing protein [Desulfovibrio inopinatus]